MWMYSWQREPYEDESDGVIPILLDSVYYWLHCRFAIVPCQYMALPLQHSASLQQREYQPMALSLLLIAADTYTPQTSANAWAA
jgi:hypothetical protein